MVAEEWKESGVQMPQYVKHGPLVDPGRLSPPQPHVRAKFGDKFWHVTMFERSCVSDQELRQNPLDGFRIAYNRNV